MDSTSSSTEVYTTPPSSPPSSQSFRFPTRALESPCSLEVDFDATTFDRPRKALGICCSVRDVWYSNRHWPEDSEFLHLFLKAMDTRDKFTPEFLRIWHSAKRNSPTTTPYTFELRMAGVRQPNSQQIHLKGSIWIRTTEDAIRDKTVWKKLQKEVQKLGLNAPQYASIYAESGLRLADETVSVRKEDLPMDRGLTFLDDLKLVTHVSLDPSGHSVCGRVCLISIVAEDEIIYQRASRIGGLFACNNLLSLELGVTSGHAMLVYSINKSRQERLEQDSSTCSGGEEGAMESETESENDIELIENDDTTNTREAGQMNLEDIKDWAPIVPYGTINFLDQLEAGAPSRRDPYTATTHLDTGIPTDFALISGLREFEFEKFIYTFHWHKNGPGTSGSWVVDRLTGALCGMIIAIANLEPYAFMLTAQTLMSDIKSYSKTVQTIEVAPCPSDPATKLVFPSLRDMKKAIPAELTHKDSVTSPNESQRGSAATKSSPLQDRVTFSTRPVANEAVRLTPSVEISNDGSHDSGISMTSSRTRLRYNTKGEPLMVGVVPLDESQNYVLLYRSTRVAGWKLPVAGWEQDETSQEAAQRKLWIEAGVNVTITYDLGDIGVQPQPKSSSDRCTYHFYEGTTTAEYDDWPKSHKRERQWFPFEQAWEALSIRPELQEALQRSTIHRL